MNLIAPTIGTSSPLSRREAAMDRGADAMDDLLGWAPPSRSPSKPGVYGTRDRISHQALTRRVVFAGHFWMQDEPVAAWRQLSSKELENQPYRPVSQIPTASNVVRNPLKYTSALLSHGQDAKELTPPKKIASSFEELSLEPMEGSSGNYAAGGEVATIAHMAQLELRIDVVRFVKPTDGANGASTGKIVAVSENYAAQSIGGDQVVIHENANLDRRVAPGEKVTMNYVDGRGTVYDGLAHDVNITADWMPKDQQAYLRMVMLDTLSQMTAPQDDDDRLRDAMRLALESTANFFGLSETKLKRADIQLAVNDKRSTIKAEEPDASVRRARHP
ncbi:hypothetical protein ABIC83_002570 [Roseateles asaccharophilus]|uniref:KfrB domain-containing protein n=1 Tax=Roseateles asaccharophilus TaxID=582607 RepID=UPI003834AD83